MTGMDVESFESTPLNDGSGHVAVVLVYADGRREYHPRMQVVEVQREDGLYEYSLRRAVDPKILRYIFGED